MSKEQNKNTTIDKADAEPISAATTLEVLETIANDSDQERTEKAEGAALIAMLPPDDSVNKSRRVVGFTSKGLLTSELSSFRGVESIALREWRVAVNRKTAELRLIGQPGVNIPADRKTAARLRQVADYLFALCAANV